MLKTETLALNLYKKNKWGGGLPREFDKVFVLPGLRLQDWPWHYWVCWVGHPLARSLNHSNCFGPQSCQGPWICSHGRFRCLWRPHRSKTDFPWKAGYFRCFVHEAPPHDCLAAILGCYRRWYCCCSLWAAINCHCGWGSGCLKPNFRCQNRTDRRLQSYFYASQLAWHLLCWPRDQNGKRRGNLHLKRSSAFGWRGSYGRQFLTLQLVADRPCDWDHYWRHCPCLLNLVRAL